MSLTTEGVAILWDLAYFGQNLVAMATSLRSLQSEMSFLHWLTPKPYPRTTNFVNSCYTSEFMSIWRFASRDKFSITGIGNFRYFCNNYGKLCLKINLTPKRTYLDGNTYYEPLTMSLRSTVRPVQVSKNIRNIERKIDTGSVYFTTMGVRYHLSPEILTLHMWWGTWRNHW